MICLQYVPCATKVQQFVTTVLQVISMLELVHGGASTVHLLALTCLIAGFPIGD